MTSIEFIKINIKNIKVQLKDITFEQYSNWYRGNGNLENACGGRDCCSESCIFHKVDCHDYSPTCWVNHKDVYNDEFLNQEIEIEVEDENILTEKEKEYLSNVIKPFRNRVSSIKKVKMRNDRYFISIKVQNKFDLSKMEPIDLPMFYNEIYKGMEDSKDYTLEELGL